MLFYKQQLTEDEKESKSLRKQIQEKLIKFATRIPIFMYLTDERERSLKDVITEISPGLFKKVTGLDVKDFDMLCSLGLFNSNLMNQAIFQFKRYEDASLSYTGIDMHSEQEIGGWDTSIRKAEYERLFYNQQSSMESEQREDDIPEAEEERVTVPSIPKSEPVSAKPSLVTEQYGYKAPEPIRKPAPKPKPKIELDLSALAVGGEVVHKMFGKGKVIALSTKMIHIQFGMGDKKFPLPDAFVNGFLKMP